jgi:hypothetical protein
VGGAGVGTVTSVAALTLGTTGTDLSSTVANGTTTPVITLNVPTASAANRGALSAADWTTFNGKENAITAGTTAQYYRGDKTFQTLNTAAVPELTNLYYTEARVNANTNVAANTAARHNAVTLGTANGLSLSTQELSLGLASSSANGALSSTDWTTFNNKQNALTNPVTGTGTAGQVAYWSSGSAITGESNLFWDATNDRLGVGTNSPATRFEVNGDGAFRVSSGNVGYSLASGADAYSFYFNDADNSYRIYSSIGTADRMILSSSGNLGLGVTPSAWGTFRALQIGTNYGALSFGGIGGTMLTNAFFDGGTYRYLNNDFASAFEYNISSGGGFVWRQAPSGTAGAALTFTQAMTLTASSKLLVNTTADSGNYFIQANGNIASINSSAAGLFTVSGTRSIGIQSFAGDWNYLRSNGQNLVFGTQDANTLYIRTSDVDRLTISSTGAATFSGIINASSAASSANGSINVDNSDPTVRFRVSGGSANKRIYEWRAIAAGGDNDRMELRLWNDAQSSASHLMSITSSGNVGIGTTSPTQPLQIGGNGNILVAAGGTFFSSGQLYIRSGTSQPLDFGANNINTLMRLTSAGRLLINTTTESTFHLDVNGTGRFSGSLRAATAIINDGTNSTDGIKIIGSLSSSLFTSGIEFIRTTVAGGSKVQPLRDAAIGGVGLNFLVTANNTAEINATYTSALSILNTGAATFSSSVTATSIIRSGGTSSQYLMADGSVSTLTNPVTGTGSGTSNTIPKFTGANALGNSIITDSGSLVSIDGNFRIRNSNGFNDSVNFDRTAINGLILNSSGNLILNGSTGSSRITCYGDGFFSGGIQTGNPYGTTAANWLLGRFLTETTSANGSIRVQIGSKYYNIAAEDLGTVPT